MKAEELAAIRARDIAAGALWFTGPPSFTALAARDRRNLLTYVNELRVLLGDQHPGYIIGSHWLAMAYARICGGEDEAVVMSDYGYAPEAAP